MLFPAARMRSVIIVLSSSLAAPVALNADIWNYVGSEDLPSSAQTIRQGIKESAVLAIIGIMMRRDGTLESVGVPTIPARSGKRPLVYPLVAFPNRETGESVLRSADQRETAIRSLLSLAESYDGLHLDFEHLGGEDIEYLEKLLLRLYPEMTARKKTLSLAVFPENFPSFQRQFHDLSRIGSLADQFVLMTYDYHRPSTEPGPVTDVKLAEEAIRLAMKHVQASKLWLGVPTYGYSWEIESGRYQTLHRKSFEDFLKCRSGTVHRHRSQMLVARCPEATFDKSTAEIAFFPDEQFVREMKLLAKRYHLRGTAHWRLYSRN